MNTLPDHNPYFSLAQVQHAADTVDHALNSPVTGLICSYPTRRYLLTIAHDAGIDLWDVEINPDRTLPHGCITFVTARGSATYYPATIEQTPNQRHL